jgi:hypothetical protein
MAMSMKGATASARFIHFEYGKFLPAGYKNYSYDRPKKGNSPNEIFSQNELSSAEYKIMIKWLAY